MAGSSPGHEEEKKYRRRISTKTYQGPFVPAIHVFAD
jgi:hypothetical protein